jgi:RNA polymerase sigma factor (sigma-70 family)
MPPDPSFDELIRRVGSGDERSAARLVRDFEPVVRRVLRARLRGARARCDFDSLDICQSVLAIFFVRVAAGEYDLKEPDDLIKLLLTMTRNKLAEKMRHQHRLRRDSRRTVGGVEELALAGRDPTPSSVVAGKELLEQARQRLSEEERQLVELRGQGLSWEEVAASLGGDGRGAAEPTGPRARPGRPGTATRAMIGQLLGAKPDTPSRFECAFSGEDSHVRHAGPSLWFVPESGIFGGPRGAVVRPVATWSGA